MGKISARLLPDAVSTVSTVASRLSRKTGWPTVVWPIGPKKFSVETVWPVRAGIPESAVHTQETLTSRELLHVSSQAFTNKRPRDDVFGPLAGLNRSSVIEPVVQTALYRAVLSQPHEQRETNTFNGSSTPASPPSRCKRSKTSRARSSISMDGSRGWSPNQRRIAELHR